MKDSIKKIENLNTDNLDMLADYLLERSTFTTKRLVEQVRNNTLAMKEALDNLLDTTQRESAILEIVNEKLEYYGRFQDVPNESKTREKIGKDTELVVELLLEIKEALTKP